MWICAIHAADTQVPGGVEQAAVGVQDLGYGLGRWRQARRPGVALQFAMKLFVNTVIAKRRMPLVGRSTAFHGGHHVADNVSKSVAYPQNAVLKG